jgi:hypothetical protein
MEIDGEEGFGIFNDIANAVKAFIKCLVVGKPRMRSDIQTIETTPRCIMFCQFHLRG